MQGWSVSRGVVDIRSCRNFALWGFALTTHAVAPESVTRLNCKHLCPWRKDFVLGLRTDFHYGFNRLPSTFFQRSVRARMALDPAHNPLEGGVKGAVLAGSLAPPRAPRSPHIASAVGRTPALATSPGPPWGPCLPPFGSCWLNQLTNL